LKSFREELEKVGTKNPVAAMGIRGSNIGAAVGGTVGAIASYNILKRIAKVAPKTPVVAAFTIASSVLGSKAGGSIGAAAGGAYKGTHNMYDINYGH
jgi:uncharacterized protein YcfJ